MKPASKGVSWGTTNIPKDKWIDPTKNYKTRNGKRIVNLHIEMENGCGHEVTYPIKGSVVLSEAPLKTSYEIWSLDGRKNVLPDSACHGTPSELDLIIEDTRVYTH